MIMFKFWGKVWWHVLSLIPFQCAPAASVCRAASDIQCSCFRVWSPTQIWNFLFRNLCPSCHWTTPQFHIPSSTVHVFGTSWFCGPCRGKLYIPKKLQNQVRLRLNPSWGVMGPKDWDWTRWKIATWAAQEHETNHEADINRFKQIQTSNTKKSVLLHFLLGMIAACYCLFPGPDLGDAKNLVFDEAGAMPNPNFECKLVELIPFKIYALHFWTGMSRLATGTQLNPTSSLIFCDWSFLEEKHTFKEHKFLKGRLLRSKCCVCQKQCIRSHTYSS